MKNLIIICSLFALWSCNQQEQQAKSTTPTQDTIAAKSPVTKPKPNDAQAILLKKQVPVLCYHQIRQFRPGESKRMNGYVVTPEAFAAQMKILKDSGYTSVLPEQLYNYLVYNEPLPQKPVMITFDDTREEHLTIGAAEMNKHDFKGVFFIMTISINRPHYMKAEQLKQLADEGHAVESHTWDHHAVPKYVGEDWDKQLLTSKEKIERITGRQVKYFAYPFGLWSKEGIAEIQKRDYQMAFILSTKRDSTQPLYTVRRMIVPGDWTTEGMLKAMKRTF
jgi:peptidoglycan/xylan/chitin deacetylase (PgdA/CDA1 family)